MNPELLGNYDTNFGGQGFDWTASQMHIDARDKFSPRYQRLISGLFLAIALASVPTGNTYAQDCAVPEGTFRDICTQQKMSSSFLCTDGQYSAYNNYNGSFDIISPGENVFTVSCENGENSEVVQPTENANLAGSSVPFQMENGQVEFESPSSRMQNKVSDKDGKTVAMAGAVIAGIGSVLFFLQTLRCGGR